MASVDDMAVIIPTYRRPDDVVRAVESLQAQTLPAFEIVVVDNAVDPALAGRIGRIPLRTGVTMRYVPEPKLGLHHARHAGARAVTAALLAYTDDDATFDPGWLVAVQDAFRRHPEMAVAGGPIRPVWAQEPPEWLRRYMEGRTDFGWLSLREPRAEFTLAADESAYGVNFVVRREVLLAVGGFNVESFGALWLGDGESGLLRKIRAAGHQIGFVPAALVWHHIPASRMEVGYFRRRAANEGAGIEYAHFHAQPITTGAILFRGLRTLVAWLTCWPRNALRGIFGMEKFPTLEAKLQSSLHASRILYLARLATSAEFRRLVRRQDWLEEVAA